MSFPRFPTQQFKTGQLVRYLGHDTGGTYVHGDILRIVARRGGEFYDIEVVASSIPRIVGDHGVLPPNVGRALPSGRPMSPAAFRRLGRTALVSEPNRP
jgi:hypothetical protein